MFSTKMNYMIIYLSFNLIKILKYLLFWGCTALNHLKQYIFLMYFLCCLLIQFIKQEQNLFNVFANFMVNLFECGPVSKVVFLYIIFKRVFLIDIKRYLLSIFFKLFSIYLFPSSFYAMILLKFINREMDVFMCTFFNI